MSGGGGGPIIIGGADLATILNDHFGKIAVFRQSRARKLLNEYAANWNSLSADDNAFMLRCADDLIDNR